jgi:hypothetical protein
MRQRVPLPPDEAFTRALQARPAVVLLGAGIYAPPAIQALRQRGIEPVAICDNAVAKQGQELMGLSVMVPAEARSRHPEAVLILSTATKYLESLRREAGALGWGRVFDAAPLLASFDYDRTSFSCGISALHFDLDRYFDEYLAAQHPELLVVPSLDIVITEKCSLKCRDCSNLMQYYTQPQDVDFDGLFAALDALMASVDHVLEFRVLGGETYMNRNAHRYIERLRQYPNVTRIAVYSNGTIIPSRENLDCLRHENVYLRISDYGAVSRSLDAMKRLFQEQGIAYDAQRIEAWQDCSGIGDRSRSEAELESVYAGCCAHNNLTLLHGRLYVCPFSANATHLGAIPAFPPEILHLERADGSPGIRKWVLQALRHTRYLSACHYCAGRDLSDFNIPAAVQAPAPLPLPQRPIGEA